MKEFSYIIKDKLGIHARPAGMLVKIASAYDSDITLIAKGKTADAKKIFSVMSLSAKNGDEVKVNIYGHDEEMAEEGMRLFFIENL